MAHRDVQTINTEILDLIGPTIQHLTPLSDDNDGFCVLKGTMAPGVIVPVHAHADHETFCVLTGQIQALKGDHWQTLNVGDVFDMPGGTKHAFRNTSDETVSALIITTMALARFFRRIGRPIKSVPAGPPSKERLQSFAQASLAEGHWLGSTEDNAAVGIDLLSFL
jgi:quercetin dioxygenase-like cupin family protein